MRKFFLMLCRTATAVICAALLSYPIYSQSEPPEGWPDPRLHGSRAGILADMPLDSVEESALLEVARADLPPPFVFYNLGPRLAVMGERVYALSADQNLVIFDRQTGNLVREVYFGSGRDDGLALSVGRSSTRLLTYRRRADALGFSTSRIPTTRSIMPMQRPAEGPLSRFPVARPPSPSASGAPVS